ncbi:hypothetical protein QSV08_07790 [Maribacter sp. BPC-D8]|uniref:hypothetical protein n=1 Tax=Maribacter sp. BPC-D8 TaxID=3053613 RepID=UPI002B4757E4|nr:hypothetical protein [Maribacter sp. BPC-D8]WRI31146.1 hypothetical protein QSV08_07790 [Maribacter sp. BPC-D8]
MNSKELHPILQVLIILLFVSLLMLFFISFAIIYFSNGDFNEIKNNYKLELQLTMVFSCLASMFIIYSNLNYRVKKNKASLNEVNPIIHWKYKTPYWKKFKKKEYQKKGLFYLLKISLIWIPISATLFFISKTESMLSIILILLILILIIPMIPFTLGKFISELKNQVFEKTYEVKVYKQGLTINEIYYPFNQYQDIDNGIRLVKIEKLNLYSTNCLSFKVEKRFYSPPTSDGGDSGSIINRNVDINIPIPKNQDIDLDKIKKQLKIK